MDIGVSAFNSSSSQVNDGIYDLGGGVFIDPTVAPQVSGGQGGSQAGGPGLSSAPSVPSLAPQSSGPFYPSAGNNGSAIVQGSDILPGLSNQNLMIIAAVVVAVILLR